MLSIEGCRARQAALLELMALKGIDTAVLSRSKTIYYFSGALTDPSWPQALLIDSSGRCTLITNLQPKTAVAAEVRTYTGYTIERIFGREHGHEELVQLAREVIGGGRTGVEAEWISGTFQAILEEETINLTPSLIEMSRAKHPDEIECMRATIRLAEAGYRAAKECLAPGITEVDVYLAIESAIVKAAGTSVDLKGDFACGVRAIGGGGPPTDRVVQRGDLFILDLFPSHEGYICDLCRTFVAGAPTEEQLGTWRHVLDAHEIARRMIRPGASTSAVYHEIRSFLDQRPGTRGSFTHHAGHGVGMDGWEQPWLNAGSDQVFVEGEVIACEPGLYAEELGGGIRLEHNYLVTSDGPVALDSFPMDL
jgi:Xaa-Pro aminopeptidase